MSAQPLQRELRKKKPFDLPEQEAMLNTLRTAWVLQGGFDRLFRARGLSMAQYNVLRILRGEGDAMPCLCVAERMVTRVPDITRLVDRLEESGLVQRTRCTEDRRVVYVAITPRGTALLASLEEPVRALHREQLGHLSKSELKELSRLLEKARATSGAGPDDAAPRPRRAAQG